MKRGKKLLSLLLALLLCLSLLPPALAEEAEGTIAPVEDLTEEGTTLPEETEAEGTIAPAEPGTIAPVGNELQDAATSGACGENLTWTLEDTGTLTISGSGTMWDWTGSNVPWSSLRASIKAVVLPNGLQNIGTYAFFNCVNLTEITIPEGVTVIGGASFFGCQGLQSIQIPASVTTISRAMNVFSGIFVDCESLTDVWFGGTMAAWEALGLNRDRYKTTIHCSDGDIAVADPTYCGDNLIWTLSNEGVLTVAGTGEMWDFFEFASPWSERRSEIKTVRLMPGLTGIGDYAFGYCQELTAVSIPAGVTSIGLEAFSFCSSLPSLAVPEGVTAIGDRAFEHCTALTAMVIPEGVRSLGGQLFYSCSALTNVTLPGSLQDVGFLLLQECTSLTEIYYGGTIAAWKELSIEYDRFKVTVHCSDGDIAAANSTDCGDNLIWTISSDGGLTIAGTGDMWDFSNDNPAPWYDRREEILEIRLMSGVTGVGSYAFYWCSKASEVDIPGTVSRIGSNAFYGCKALTEVLIPEGVKSIGSGAFFSCDHLIRVTIPATVTSIGSRPFAYNAALTEIVVAEENENYHSLDGVLYDKAGNTLLCCPCGKPGTLEVPDGVTEIGYYACEACILTSVNLPDSLESVSTCAFLGSGLTSLLVPAHVSKIGIEAFGYCSGLEEIRFTGAAPHFDLNAFPGVTAAAYYPQADASWTDAVRQDYGGSITWVGYGPVATGQCGDDLTWSLDADGTLTISGTGDMWDFDFGQTPWWPQNSEIKQLQLMSGVASIGSLAFYSCSQLSSVTIPKEVTRIGSLAFASCTSLGSLTLPDGLTVLESSVFARSGLAEIVIPGSLSDVGSGVFTSCFGLRDIYYGSTKASWQRFKLDYDHYTTTVHCSDGDIAPADPMYCGDDLIWTLSDSGVLTIAGTGPMWDFWDGHSPWAGNTSVKSLRLISGITEIGDNAFYGLGLTEVTIPEEVRRIGDSAFRQCEELRTLQLPESLEEIERFAFASCSALTGVRIPASVASIEAEAFAACGSLEAFAVDEKNPSFSSVDGLLCDKAGEKLIQCPGGKAGRVAIPEGIRNVQFAAFSGCKSITALNVPASVIEIGTFMFWDCSSLTTIVFHGSAPAIWQVIFAQSVPATAYYPGNDPSWTEETRQGYGGTITWVPYLPGDANDDDAVDVLDLVRLRKQLAVISVELNEISTDLNGDWEITPLDLIRMRRLLVGDPA